MKKRVAVTLLAAFLAVLFLGCQKKEVRTINGVSIEEYTVVCSQDTPDYCQRAAQYIQTQVKARTGVTLPIRKTSSGSFAHEIVVGESDRPISQQLDAQTQNVEFAILADGNHIALEGDYFIIAAAAYYFVETYIPGSHFESTVPQTTTIHQPITEKANNFIFLIGDGMGENHTLLFEKMNIEETSVENDGENIFYGYYLPYQGYVKTDSLNGTTDSAAAATALATGFKTLNGYVGMDEYGNDRQSLTELAISKGMATAVMSTEGSTGATPGGFSAHVQDRGDGAGILNDQDLLADKGTIISCDLNSDYAYEEEIQWVLSELGKNETGFFMMYEEAHIDKYSHSNDETGTFNSMVRFNQAIGLFMEFAFYHPDTFLIITADHETGGLYFYDSPQGWPTYSTEGHTDADVKIFGYGQGAEVFQDFHDENNRIPKEIAALWGVTHFGSRN